VVCGLWGRKAPTLWGREAGGGVGEASVCVWPPQRLTRPPLASPSPHTISSTTRYQAHDAEGKASLGDIVRLDPIRPMSKTKRFAVAEIVKKGD
jgi:hypothetical protein